MDEREVLTALHPDHIKVMRVATLIATIPFVSGSIALEIIGLLPTGAFALPVLLAAGFIVIRVPLRRYGARGYVMGEDRLRVVRGVLFRSDTVVPFGRVQHIDVDQGPLERAYGLATLTLHTAGNHNASVSLPGLADEDARAMRESIRARIGRDTR